jgi:hypothetical protein
VSVKAGPTRAVPCNPFKPAARPGERFLDQLAHPTGSPSVTRTTDGAAVERAAPLDLLLLGAQLAADERADEPADLGRAEERADRSPRAATASWAMGEEVGCWKL